MAKHGLPEPVLCHDRYNIARILSRFLTFKTIATKLGTPKIKGHDDGRVLGFGVLLSRVEAN
jgi:hypothetical protein